jgi:uncharacterized protein YcfJ
MKKLWLPALMAGALFSTGAFAHHDDWDDRRWEHRHPRKAKHVVVHHVHEEPQVVYRDRIVYRDRPVYYESAPRSYEPEPVPAPAAPAYGGNRLMGQVVGAIAGSAIGSQIGRGNGRIAATAIGAVIGGAVGGHAAAGYRAEGFGAASP